MHSWKQVLPLHFCTDFQKWAPPCLKFCPEVPKTSFENKVQILSFFDSSENDWFVSLPSKFVFTYAYEQGCFSFNVEPFNKQHMRHDCENFFYICRRDRTPSSCLLCLGCRDLQLSLLFGRNEATPKERFFFFSYCWLSGELSATVNNTFFL